MSEGGAEGRESFGDPGAAADWTRATGRTFTESPAFVAIRDHVRDGDTQCVDWCPICRAADLLRANASPELREQWQSVQREALLTLRALIDHYVEGGDANRGDRGPRVEDIPIE